MPRIHQNHYVLAVHDLPESAAFFEDKPWKMREFGVRSPEGHRLTMGQWIGE